MGLTFEPLGKYVRLVDERNTGLVTESILGINIDKFFMPSVANVIGTDLENYKLLRKGRFACNPMHVGRDGRLPVARYTEETPAIVSPAYFMFEIEDENEIEPEYLMLCFRRPDFDRMCWFRTDASVRGGITWADVCALTIPVPPLPEQRKIVREYQVITDRIALLRKMNEKYVETGTYLFRSAVEGIKAQYSEAALYDIAGYINGTSFAEEEYADSGFPIIKIAELKDGITAATQFFVGEKEEKYFIEDGDVLFSWSGNPETSIDAFIWSHGNGILNQHTFKMVCSHGKAFTFFMLKYCKPDFVKAAHGKQTTGLGHVTVQDLKRLTIPFDADKAKEFNDAGTPIFDSIFRNLKEINLLNKMKAQHLISLSRSKGA